MNGYKFAPLLAVLLLVPIMSASAASYDSPLKQSASMSAEMVQCNYGLELIIKNSNGSPVCVKPDTKAVLIERGWATAGPERDMMMMDDKMMMDDDKMMMDDDKMMMDDEMMMDDDKMMMDDEMMMDDDKMMMDDEMMMNDNEGDSMDADTSMIDDFDTDVDPGEIDDSQDGAAMNGDSMSTSMGSGDTEMTAVEFALTEEEMTWLDENQIRVVYDKTWEPIEYQNDDGEIAGLSAAYIAKFTELLGSSEFEIIHVENWTAVLADIQVNEADIVMMVASTADREEYMSFTTPHTIIPVHMITATDKEISPDELVGLDVITIKGYATEAWLDENLSNVTYRSVPDITAAINEIESGDAKVFIEAFPIASYHAGKADTTVYNAGELGYEYDLSVGYSNETPIIGDILEKALASISEQQKEMMLAEILQ